MSKYTTEVRYICETESGLTESVGFSDVDNVISKSWDKIFTTNCKFFDEEYRKILCSKILKHFYLREICSETVGIWKLWVNTRLEEIMPYYNQLYSSELIKFNPMYDTDVTTTHDRTNKGETTETNTGNRKLTGKSDTIKDGNKDTNATNQGTTNTNNTHNGTKYDLYSDTPQGALTGVDTETYLSNARKVTENTTDTGTTETNDKGKINEMYHETIGNTYSEGEDTSGNRNGTANSTEEYLEHVIGKRGGESYSSMLLKYRETFLNIDMLVIHEFNDLFFNLW